MRKFIVACCLICFSTFYAQHGKVVSSWKFLNDYYATGDSVSLNKAHAAIDLASNDESTKDEAKTWFYKAKIYQALFEQCYKEGQVKNSAAAEGKRAILSYQGCNASTLITATDAYIKTRGLDIKQNYDEELPPRIKECINHITNKGIAEYNVQRLKEALPLFEKAISVNALMGITDTLDIYNAAQIADLQMDFARARDHYQKLIDIKADKPETYRRLANAYKELKDVKKQGEILKAGRVKYPKDSDLLTDEINFYLASSNPDDLKNTIDNLKQSLEKNPNDVLLNLALGNVYDRLANPKDAEGKFLEKPKDFEEYLSNAETHYKKAADVAPNDFDALYYLGALYVNQGSYLLDKAVNINDNVKYKKEADNADIYFKKSLPYLEKAMEINGSDLKLLYALKQLYSRLDMKDKLQTVKEKMHSLQK